MIPLRQHDARRTDAALQPLGVGPVPAPTVPWANFLGRAAAAARSPNEASGRLRKSPADAEVEQHGGGHDRHDVVGFGADLEPAAALGEPPHHPVGGGEPVGAAAGEAHGVDPCDER